MANSSEQHHQVIKGTGMLVFLLCGMPSSQAEVPMPKLAQASGEQCVEDTAFMRRNHMDLLKHQRDKTLRQGIRSKSHSLQGCLDCHAIYDNNQQIVDIKNDKHFCNSCHNYAAVKIDCFDCHSSTPLKNNPSAGI